MCRNMYCFTLSICETMTMCSVCRLVSLGITTEPTYLVDTVDSWGQCPSL